MHGLATVGYDDEGVVGQSWELICGGALTGYQLDSRMAQLDGFGRVQRVRVRRFPRHTPLQRMANLSLRPAEGRTGTADLVAAVENGI